MTGLGERIDRGHGDYTEADCQARQRNYQLDRSGEVTGQHPIGQLAAPNVFGCIHGQDEEQPAAGGVHAQREPQPSGEDVADAVFKGPQRSGEGWEADNIQREGAELRRATTERGGWWQSEPDVGRVADGVVARVDRLKAIGNGQVPAVVRLAWNTLYERIQSRVNNG